MADSRDWLNQGQPQTLVIACMLLYIDALFGLLGLAGGGIIGLVIGVTLIAGGVMAGRGIAQEKRWGYQLGLVMAFAPFALRALIPLVFGQGLGNPFGRNLISLAFEIALVALLLHPQSQEYRKIWFR